MPDNFRLVDRGWGKEIGDALQADHSGLRIVCPFIKEATAKRLLAEGTPRSIRVITRFNLADFHNGVSDTKALRLLLARGAKIRGVKNLHAKIYLFGERRAVVTSANLTEAALLRNHEFGFVAEDARIVARCADYFENLWGRAGKDLAVAQMDGWDARLDAVLAGGARPSQGLGLGDEGTDAGEQSEPAALPAWVAESTQVFVKFFGEGNNRVPGTKLVLDEVKRSGSHWACSYPAARRPRSVQDGATMFMGRLSTPRDILIYGRATAMRHVEGRDDATPEDIARRPWKATWPRYVRVHHAEFVAGTLSNGVSLNELMVALQADAFAVTQRNAAAGVGNADPHRAYRQQAAVQLSPQGAAWLNERLQSAFDKHGKIPAEEMEKLDWPTVPGIYPPSGREP